MRLIKGVVLHFNAVEFQFKMSQKCLMVSRKKHKILTAQLSSTKFNLNFNFHWNRRTKLSATRNEEKSEANKIKFIDRKNFFSVHGEKNRSICFHLEWLFGGATKFSFLACLDRRPSKWKSSACGTGIIIEFYIWDCVYLIS